MASSRNGGGMRILWIPGRKKHDRKGIYAGTSKVCDFVIPSIFNDVEIITFSLNVTMTLGSQQELLATT